MLFASGVDAQVELIFCLIDQYLKMFKTHKIYHQVTVKTSNSDCVNDILQTKLNLLTFLSNWAFAGVILNFKCLTARKIIDK